MKLKILLAVTILCVATSGCMPLETSVENLMQPPTLTDLQTEVDAALRDAVGGDFNLKYPEKGEYRSGYNFLDLDGDDINEAVAFVTTGDDTIRLALLRQDNERWYVSDLVPGLAFCTEVDFISVEKIGSMPRLLVGWGGTGRENNLLALYSYSTIGGKASALDIDSSWGYSQVSVVDIDRNGQDELMLLIAADSYEQATPSARLVGESADGIIDMLAETELSRNIIGYYPPVAGTIGNGLYGIAADCKLGNGNIATVTISYDGSNLLLPLNEVADNSLFRATTRSQQVLSCDIDNNGTVDIPVQRLAAGYENHSGDAVYFVDYCNLVGEELAVVKSAYINSPRGYRLLLPDEWSTHPVSALVQQDNREVIFFINSTGNLYDHSKELLRIQATSTLDVQDKLSEGRYFQLAAKGTYIYSAALPDNQLEGVSVSKQYLEQAFALLG